MSETPQQSAGPADGPGAADGPTAAPGGPGAPAEQQAQRLRAAVADLGQVAELPIAEHAAHYDEVHRQLRAALADLDG